MGTLGIEKKSVNLNSLINETVNGFKTKIKDNGCELSVVIDKNLSGMIYLDIQKLRFILNTLLTISTSLTVDGSITLKAVPLSRDSIEFTLLDTGEGFHTESAKDLFNPYAIFKNEKLRKENLTGLSLTLVKRFVNLMGGGISIESIRSRGTTIKFTIIGEVMTEIDSKLSQLPKDTANKKVLVIEDDYATSKLLSNYLNKWGYEPTIVNTPEQTLALIQKETFLAVILDIELPNTNALELLKKVKEHPGTKNVPVIVCSVEAEEQKAFMMGAVEFFIKPINYNYLVEVLTNYKLRKNSNILCVDDDIPTLNLLKRAIETAGFNAIAESVSANVIDLIRDKDLDLAIIDLDMPDPNGYELIKLIKSESKFSNLPVIIYTGKENYQEDLKKIDGLFEDLLEKKSTNIEDLADTINLMINRYETPPPVEEVLNKQNVVKILLAEDYKHSQIIVTRLLKKNNFENIVVVENGEEALNIAKKEKFDLILMDMQMPIMNGFEATEALRQMTEYKDVPIIALTAFAMKGDREKCLEAGATDYIPKPIDSKEFIEKVIYYTTSKT